MDGGNCFGYGRLASGFVDIGIEWGLDPFDYCAHVPVIRNAGGRITDWDGGALGLGEASRIVACGDPALHDEVLAVLNDDG